MPSENGNASFEHGVDLDGEALVETTVRCDDP